MMPTPVSMLYFADQMATSLSSECIRAREILSDTNKAPLWWEVAEAWQLDRLKEEGIEINLTEEDGLEWSPRVHMPIDDDLSDTSPIFTLQNKVQLAAIWTIYEDGQRLPMISWKTFEYTEWDEIDFIPMTVDCPRKISDRMRMNAQGFVPVLSGGQWLEVVFLDSDSDYHEMVRGARKSVFENEKKNKQKQPSVKSKVVQVSGKKTNQLESDQEQVEIRGPKFNVMPQVSMVLPTRYEIAREQLRKSRDVAYMLSRVSKIEEMRCISGLDDLCEKGDREYSTEVPGAGCYRMDRPKPRLVNGVLELPAATMFFGSDGNLGCRVDWCPVNQECIGYEDVVASEFEQSKVISHMYIGFLPVRRYGVFNTPNYVRVEDQDDYDVQQARARRDISHASQNAQIPSREQVCGESELIILREWQIDPCPCKGSQKPNPSSVEHSGYNLAPVQGEKVIPEYEYIESSSGPSEGQQVERLNRGANTPMVTSNPVYMDTHPYTQRTLVYHRTPVVAPYMTRPNPQTLGFDTSRSGTYTNRPAARLVPPQLGKIPSLLEIKTRPPPNWARVPVPPVCLTRGVQLQQQKAPLHEIAPTVDGSYGSSEEALVRIPMMEESRVGRWTWQRKKEERKFQCEACKLFLPTANSVFHHWYYTHRPVHLTPEPTPNPNYQDPGTTPEPYGIIEWEQDNLSNARPFIPKGRRYDYLGPYRDNGRSAAIRNNAIVSYSNPARVGVRRQPTNKPQVQASTDCTLRSLYDFPTLVCSQAIPIAQQGSPSKREMDLLEENMRLKCQLGTSEMEWGPN